MESGIYIDDTVVGSGFERYTSKQRMHRWAAALAGDGTRETAVGTVGAVATGMTQARADVVTIVSTDEEVDTEWCMVDPVPERTVTFTEAGRCICAALCENLRCEARVCPALGSMESVFCEHCSEYVCDCHIYGHNECGSNANTCVIALRVYNSVG